MSLNGFYTTAGRALAAKCAAGTALVITKVCAGSGQTAESASALADLCQTLAVGAASTDGAGAELPVTLSEAQAAASYTLTELGVYAKDPDAGEILYQVYRLTTPHGVTAGGEDTLRFYLRQSVGAGGVSVPCSPAGLLTEEDFAPVRGKVLQTWIPSRTVTVSPGALTDYVANLPRLLTENLTVQVSAGTVPDTLSLTGFFGSGSLRIEAAKNAAVTCTLGCYISRCTAKITLSGLTFSGTGWGVGGGWGEVFLFAESSPSVTAQYCTVTGSGTGCGILSNGSTTLFAYQCGFSGLARGAYVSDGGICALMDCTGSSNTIGILVYRGGMALLAGSTPVTLGGAANDKNGGFIMQKAGTLA